MGEARNRRLMQATEESDMSIERYDFAHVPTIEEMEGQFNAATPGQWRQGHSTHNVVSVNPDAIDPKQVYGDSYAGRDVYRIGDFHHGKDGWFAIMAHKFVPWAIAEIRRLNAERQREPKP